MKKRVVRTIVAMTLAMMLSLGTAVVPGTGMAAADSPLGMVTVQAATVKLTGTYHQTDARKMLKKINKFRTGKNAWYWNETNSAKVKAKGLKNLTYDYKLEKVAMKRAAEIAVSFSHTRPNGQLCFSLYPDGYMWKGENIAMGTSGLMTCSNTFKMWQETNYPYSGQGHRRNMLSSGFTSVGIACFEYKGAKYWVQEFGSPLIGKKMTKAVDGKKTVKVAK
ncbi:MAG: CAP domain-containing protein [Lachnospiraceae bacterium]|nr:CAP domain-containing protein [Lachnospiraceae bacterium]